MYVRMPALTADERFHYLRVLDGSAVTVAVTDAAAAAGAASMPVPSTMVGARPVYRFAGRTPATVPARTSGTLGANRNVAVTRSTRAAVDNRAVPRLL